MVFQGLDQGQAEAVWRPFLAWVKVAPKNFAVAPALRLLALPARRLWDPTYLNAVAPGVMVADDRPGAPADNVLFAGDQQEAGQFIAAYDSLWLPAALLRADQQQRLADALFASSRHWGMALHFNKELAGAPADVVAAARDTAMNPAALDAFALAICAAAGPTAFPGIPGHAPDLATARDSAASVDRAMREIAPLAPDAGSYVSESSFFNDHWQQAFWGGNYARLAAVKQRYDPDGLFIVHHGIGSEAWSDDGFTRRA